MNPGLTPHNLVLGHPGTLAMLAVAGIVALWGIVCARERVGAIAPIMRAIAIVLFVLAMANPERVASFEGAARPAIVDASASITPAMRAWAAKLLREDLHLRPADPALLFATVPVQQTIGAIEQSFETGTQCPQCQSGATNIEAALDRIAADPDARAGGERGGPAVLVTDGWETRGSAEHAISQVLAAQISLDIFTPPPANSISNVAMTGLELPRALAKAQPFAVGVSMSNFSDAPVAGSITVYRDGASVETRHVMIAPGSERFDFPAGGESPGLASYRAEFKPDNPTQDAYLEDDSLQGWVGVGARRKVLILTDTAKDAEYLRTVVQRIGLEPSVVPMESGAWSGSLAGYSAVLLDNLASNRIAPSAQNAIAAYVNGGGSLAMIGGDSSFGLGGYASSPIAAAMPVVMKPPEHKERKRALVLVIDKSGSMGRNDKLTYAKAAAETVTASLEDTDLVGVIGFDSQPFEVVPLEPLSQSRPYFNQMINRLTAHGTTYLMPALREAERTLGASGAQIQHVVILTDGETGGTADMYYDLVSRMHHGSGTTISTIAIGQEANVELLQAISRYGGGAYYQTDSARNLPQLFVEDFRAHGGETTMVESQFIPHTVAPDPILKDLAGRPMPPLKGYVSTTMKPHADLSMFVDRGGTREPIIASWKYGSGRAMAITTDASGRWSGAWVTNGVFQPLWDRLLAWMTPETAAEPKIDVALGYAGGRITIKLTDYGAQTAESAHPVAVTVTRPGGGRAETALVEDAPGELSGSIDAPAPGDYYFEVRSASGPERKFPPLAYTVSPAVNAELPRPAPNYELLEQLASATGGRLNPPVAEVATARPIVQRRESVASYLIILAMLVLIGEAMVRRLTA
ncbi:MAG TPA: VWA domain-containing protein [Candidatus Binataceae bacterium]|nr:VWA domain-containing protein [Candidatus Binataceae bacterium]